MKLSLIGSILIFFLGCIIWILFDRLYSSFQCIIWIYDFWTINIDSCFNNSSFYFIPTLGIDGLSIFFFLLTLFLVPLCLIASWNLNYQKEFFCVYFLTLELLLLFTFLTLDFLSFFICFESLLIPMFSIIIIWGSRERKIKASLLFFLYTILGSICLLFILFILYCDFGTTNFSIISKVCIDYNKQLVLWPAVFFSFSIKIPIIPFHSWLPEAHVEAPTTGSVILASLLLKLGGYGYLRIMIPIFSKVSMFYQPLIDCLAIISIIYASLIAIRQIDLKRIVAYSSIAHMNLVVLGIFCFNIQGILGAIFLMLAHGIVSSGLFFCIGFLYDRHKTRNIYYYGGLLKVMPVFSSIFFIFSLANIGLPITCNFIGELVIFIGLVDKNFFVFFMSLTSIIFSVVYSMCDTLLMKLTNY